MLEGWRRCTVGDLIKEGAIAGLQDGNHGNDHPKASDYVPEGVPFLMARDLQNGAANVKDCAFISREQADALRIGFARPGDVLLSHKGTVGAVAVVPTGYDYVMLTPQVTYYRIGNAAQLDRDYLVQYFKGPEFQARLARISGQSTRAYVGITEQKRLPIVVPPLPEQRKIAKILRTWDEAIEACEREREAKAKALTAARQRVFGLDGSPPARWPSAKLEAIVDRVRRQADGADHPVMTISGKSGFKRQDEKFERFMAGDSVNRYLLLERGEFAYNKGNSKTYPQGCIYRLEQDTALVPFVYFAFALRDELKSDFFVHLFEAGFLNHQLSRLINSGVRNDGLLNIYADDFFGCVVPVPPEPEQERIASFFNLAKQELAALDRQDEALRQQKRGLMQKLLTGEWRVKAEAD